MAIHGIIGLVTIACPMRHKMKHHEKTMKGTSSEPLPASESWRLLRANAQSVSRITSQSDHAKSQ